MSNRVGVQICKFVDYRLDGGPGDESWGYRIYDDYGQDYDNNYESFEDVITDINEENILRFIENNHNDFHGTVVHKNGLYLCGSWVEVTERMSDDE